MHLTYPATSANFNTNYVIFKKVESFLKKYKRRMFFSRKIWNHHECFICENENFKINYSTNIVEVAKVLGHIVIGPHGIRKYHTTCCHVPQATQFEA